MTAEHPQFDVQMLRDHVSKVTLGNRLDNSNAPAMLQLINETKDKGVRFIILNCQNVELLSSAGVGSILGSVDNLRQANGDIILCNLSPQVRRVLEVLDLHEYLTIALTQTEAEAICA